MSATTATIAGLWMRVGTRLLPFADAATPELPLGRLFRLSLFQVSVGMAAVLLIGTLNRVMIVELGVSATLVAVMVSLPLVFAPLRAFIGFRSDTHRSVLGWRRVPYIWFGSLLQFGGFAFMPFALLILSGDTHGPIVIGHISAAAAFLLVGAGMHTVQTVGLALATDLAPEHARPRVVAMLCAMLLVGMVGSSILFGLLLANFSQIRLIQVIQGAAVATMALNIVALWKQEARDPGRTTTETEPGAFGAAWRRHASAGRTPRRLLALALGTAGFTMQDILLEPYGGQVLGLSVAATTALTALMAGAGVAGLVLAARRLSAGADPHRVAAGGATIGVFAFCLVLCAGPLGSVPMLALGVAAIGFGGGLFAHGTLTAAMASASREDTGFSLGAWGAVQATAAGLAIALGGAIRDLVGHAATRGGLGEALESAATGYGAVYLVEIVLLFATLAAIGPLVGRRSANTAESGPGHASP